MVTEISPRTPAARARFVMPGDILLEMNDNPISSARTLDLMLSGQEELGEDDEPRTYIFRLNRRGEIRECGIRGNSLRCGTVR